MTQASASEVGYGKYSLLRTSPGQSVSLSVTGPQRFDGSQSFEIGLWIRPLAANNAGNILVRPGCFTLALSSGQITFQLNGGSLLISPWALTANSWHYVWVQYSPTQGTQGNAGLFVDSVPTGPPVLSSWSGQDTLQPFVVGGTISADFLAVTLWSSSLAEPAWSPPQPDATGLVAAFDFANGPGLDLSPNHFGIQIHGASQLWMWPAMQGNGTGGYAQPNPADELNPVNGSAPFTIMFSVVPYLNAQLTGGIVIASGDANSQTYFAFYTALVHNNSSAQFEGVATFSGTNVGSPAPLGGIVAITYNGSDVVIYYDGQQVANQTVGTLSAISQPNLTFGARRNSGISGGFDGFLNGYLQNVAIWPVALGAAEVVSYQTVSPLMDPRCTCYATFLDREPTNLVSGHPVSLLGGAAIAELSFPVAAQQENLPLPKSLLAVQPRPKLTAYPHSVRFATQKAIADLNVDLTVPPKSSLIDEAGFGAIQARFEEVLKEAPENIHHYLREQHKRNLYAGFHLYEQNHRIPLLGQFTWTTEDNYHVFRYYGVNGTEVLDRVSTQDLTPCGAWIINLVVQCVSMVLDLLLLGFAARNLYNAIKRLYEANAVTFAGFVNEMLRGPVSGETAIKALKSMYQAGLLGQVLMGGLSGLTFWNLVFAITSGVISIAALWLTGPAYFAIILVILAADVYKLIAIIDSPNRPANCP